jgi:hypothetical protein
MRLDGSHKRGKVEVETPGDAIEVLESDVAQSAFDPGNVSHVESGQIGDVLLGQVPRDPQVPDRGPESDEQGSAIGGHATTLWPTQPIRP